MKSVATILVLRVTIEKINVVNQQRYVKHTSNLSTNILLFGLTVAFNSPSSLVLDQSLLDLLPSIEFLYFNNSTICFNELWQTRVARHTLARYYINILMMASIDASIILVPKEPRGSGKGACSAIFCLQIKS